MNNTTISNGSRFMAEAIWNWINDNSMLPHIHIDPRIDGVVAPHGLLNQDNLVFNIGMNAVVNLVFGDEYISFSAKFNGRHEDVWIPYSSIKFMSNKEVSLVAPFIDFLSISNSFTAPMTDKKIVAPKTDASASVKVHKAMQEPQSVTDTSVAEDKNINSDNVVSFANFKASKSKKN